MFAFTAENDSRVLNSVWHPLREIRYLISSVQRDHAIKLRYIMVSKWLGESWVY